MKRSSVPPPPPPPPPRHAASAATSHHANDAYAARFDSSSGPALHASLPAPIAPRRLSPPSPATAAPSFAPAGLAAWTRGPADPAGRLVPLSDRPLLCSDVDHARGEVVVGGADHALYAVSVGGKRGVRHLFGPRAGHTEWVTSCTYLADGSGGLASAAMDGKIIVWDTGGAGRTPPRCYELLGHFGSISTVISPAVLTPAPLLCSAGYDKTVRLWSAGGGTGSALDVLRVHDAPVLTLAASPCGVGSPLLLASGDRDGVVCVSDLGGAAATAVDRRAGHRGHITALCWAGGTDSPALLLTGAQDGCVKVWDARSPVCCASVEAHVPQEGVAAVEPSETSWPWQAAAAAPSLRRRGQTGQCACWIPGRALPCAPASLNTRTSSTPSPRAAPSCFPARATACSSATMWRGGRGGVWAPTRRPRGACTWWAGSTSWWLGTTATRWCFRFR